MKSDLLPISVNICTLNEEKNIARTLESVLINSPSEILVIDGGSKDATINIVNNFPKVKLYCVGSKGLSYQRQFGIEHSLFQYIGIVDADDMLDPNCLKILFAEMVQHGYKAIQAQLKSYNPISYWEKGMHENVSRLVPGPTKMVGRPALYDKSSLLSVGFDSNFKCGAEDTNISIRFEEAGYPQGIGTGISYRKHSETFGECWKKWKGYGREDAMIIFKYPYKFNSLFFHISFRYPFLLPFRLKGYKKIYFWPFYFLCGARRTLSCLFRFIQLFIQYRKYENFFQQSAN